MASVQPIRVILIDDHVRVHEAVTIVLNTVDDIVLLGHGSNGQEALTLCEQLHPDLVLMDVVMPGMNGKEAANQIRQRYPETKILVLSSFQDDESVRLMLAYGASGYILKGALAHDLVSIIRTVHAGGSVFSNEVTQMLLQNRQSQTAQPQDFGLTQREVEVLRLMTDGLNNGEIAARLVISQSTVKFHIVNILKKMGVETRPEAIVLAVKNQLL